MRKAVWNDCCRPMKQLVKMVGVRGFEPPAPASRRQCSTRLSYTPMLKLNDTSLPSLFSGLFSRIGIPRTLLV